MNAEQHGKRVSVAALFVKVDECWPATYGNCVFAIGGNPVFVEKIQSPSLSNSLPMFYYQQFMEGDSLL